MKKIIPVIITTIPALGNALKEEYALLYLDNGFLSEKETEIIELLRKNLYEQVFPGKNGVFFKKRNGEETEAIHKEEILDPFSIL